VSETYNPRSGLIVVPVVIHGPTHFTVARLALDTGATGTLVNLGPLVSIGYDPSLAPERIQVTTGSGVEFAPRLPIVKIAALGCTRENFPVLAHTLPPSAVVDGLLGLDFFRGGRLEVDFRAGIVQFEI
jgi:aspartyl protease family protein